MTKEEIIRQSFREYPKTIGQVSRETGISKNEVRQYVREMEKSGTIWKLYRRLWPMSEFMAYVWTTNGNIAWGYRVNQALSGKRYSAEEQIAVIRTIRNGLGYGK